MSLFTRYLVLVCCCAGVLASMPGCSKVKRMFGKEEPKETGPVYTPEQQEKIEKVRAYARQRYEEEWAKAEKFDRLGALKQHLKETYRIDLDKLFRSGAVTGGTTVFDSLTASYRISGGNLQNDDLLLMLSSFRVTGKGRIGLGARDLDYLVTPVAFQSATKPGLQVPVRITGPWSNPRIRPDLDAASKARLEEEKDKLEQKAKDRLQQELGVEVKDGQDPEEAIKDRLEDEAAKQLKKLLGGN